MRTIFQTRKYTPYLYGLLFLFLFSVASNCLANEKDPFEFKATVSPASILLGAEATVAIRGNIAKGHYLYADKTTVTSDSSKDLSLGELKKPRGSKKNDPYLGVVYTYAGQVTLTLPMRIAASHPIGPGTLTLTIHYQGCTDTACFPPEAKPLKVSYTVASLTDSRDGEKRSIGVPTEDATETDEWRPPPDNRSAIEKAADRFGVIGVLIAAFMWGFLASLTPCVYPMIPITVSVIGAGAQGKWPRGLLLSGFYVLGMSLTYALFGVAAAWSGHLFGAYTDHPAVRIIVAAIFVILALGMFDLIYIQMPSSISSKLGGKTGTGIIGVFITGAAAGAIVGPCVGPMLVGLLVYIASLADKFLGFFIMWSFALGMGMLFLLIGTFSGVATSLPKAGQWMERIKSVFGVLLLGAALYYIQPLLPMKVFYLILGALLVSVGLYLGALDGFTSEISGKRKIWQAAGIIFLVLGVCYTARFALDDYARSIGPTAVQPAGIHWQYDEAAALAQAKRDNKPVMIDFRADWCSACQKLEHETFVHPNIVAESARFVNLQIDCTDANDPRVKQHQKKYHVVGLPTLFFVNADGKPLPDQSITRFVTAETLLSRMRAIK